MSSFGLSEKKAHFRTDIVNSTSYAKDKGFGRILNDAVCLSLFDGGNVGVRRRQLQRLLEEEDYESRLNL